MGSLRFSVLLILLSAALLSSHAAGAQFSQQGPKLVGTGAVGNAYQGYSVALSADGNTALVGGLADNSNAGAAWVYTRTGGVWTQQGLKLVGTGAVGNAGQGRSVALSADGNTALVGGFGDNSNAGAAWVYSRSGGVWSQQGAKLVGTGAVGAAEQGISVALSADGNTAIVGGAGDNGLSGAVWVFTRSGGTWTQQGAKLVGTGAVGAAEQGISVALSADGNTAIVGGASDNGLSGAVWVFTRSGGTWTQQGAKLVGTGAAGSGQQGYSVALSGDGNTALVGGPGDNSSAGAVWVFARSTGTWTQQGAKLVGTDAVGGPEQGYSVALSGDGNTAIAGGPSDDTGAAWVYTRTGGVWTQQGAKLVGTGAVGVDVEQGTSVALSADGNTAIVGGPNDNSGVGAAWVYISRAIAGAIGLVYKSLEPCRIMDTRFATVGSGVQGPLTGNTLYQIPGFIIAGQNWGQYGGAGASDCGLTNPPGNAIHAVAIVITILNPNFDAYLGVGDINDLNTTLSTVALNYTHGQGLSTMYLVPQDLSNVIYFALPAGLSANLIFDVVGYYVLSDATALECTTQTSPASTIAGSGGTGNASSPVCGAGYALTSGSCDSDSFSMNLVQDEASGQAWFCSAINSGGSAAHLTATANCCRASGK